MPRNPGRICTQCGARLTAPCDGADANCFRNKKIKPKTVKRTLTWGLVLFVLGLLTFACESDHYEQIAPTTCIDRDTGYVVIFNRWAHLPDDTMAVIRIEGTFYENACEAGIKRKLLPITAPTLSYWKDSRAASKFEHCKEQ
jgi:hypothetical protein